MALRNTVSTLVHIRQPGTKGTGAAHNGDDITAATTAMRGTVKQGAAVAAPAAATAVAAAGTAPTKAEFDALLADVNALRTTVSDLRAALVAAGSLA